MVPGRWSRLRQRLGIISPLEYLVARYDLPAQQVLAWSGALLKIFDVGAKWTAAAILLQVFADVPALWGVLLTGSVTVVYSVVGGLWADALSCCARIYGPTEVQAGGGSAKRLRPSSVTLGDVMCW